MNGKYLLFQLFFIVSVFINLFIVHNLFLKILLIFLLFLYGLLILPEFKHNRSKFVFIACSFIILSILFLIAGYFVNTIYLAILSCILIAFWYFSKTIFNTTYGEVVISTSKSIQVKIKDIFYNYNKIYTIDTTIKPKLKSLVLIKLDNSIFRKPISIIDVICDNEEITEKSSKTQKITKKQIKTRKNTNISRKKKKK